MYKIIIITFLLCVTTASLNRIETINDMGLSSSGMEYPSSDNGVTNKRTRLTRTKRSPLMYLVPINDEHGLADNEMTEKSRPSRKIKRCKTGLCKAENLPLSKEYGNGMVKATADESVGEPYERSTRWKQIRTAKNSMVSKLFKKETDSSENDDDNNELAESLGEKLANERNNENYPSDRKYGEKSGKFVCYCQREDCPDCPSPDSRKELVGAVRTREKTKDKFKKDKYRKLLRPNDYAIPKIPLVRLPELYREIPYDLRRNYGNANKMDVVPIVRGIPPNVHPLTVPFRVAYDPADTYLGASGPISQQYQQKFNNIYKHVPLKQHTVASKSKSGIPRKPSASMSKNNNDFTTIANRFKENDNDNDLDPEESTEDDTNYGNINKEKNQEDHNFITGSNENIGSARKYYETSSAEGSTTNHGDNEDYYDVTESYTVSSVSPYNVMNVEENDDDRRLSNDRSLGNYPNDYSDSTIADVSTDAPEYVTSVIQNDQSSSDDYYNSETPEHVTIDSTEAAILKETNGEEDATTLSTDTNMSNNIQYNKSSNCNDVDDSSTARNEFVDSTEAAILEEVSNQTEHEMPLVTDTNSNNNIQYNNIYNIEYKILNPENKSSNCNNVNDFSNVSTKIGDETSTETILNMALTIENDFSSSTINNTDETSTDMTLTLENQFSQSQNNDNYDDFTSTMEGVDETSTNTILGDQRYKYTEEPHLGLDYSDIQVVTNSYFTSKGYDESEEKYITGLDPSASDYHIPNDGSVNALENSPSDDTNLQATHIPEMTKEQINLVGVLPTKSYFDLAKSRSFTDSTMNDDLDIDKSTTQGSTDLLNKKSTNCEDSEHKLDDQGKEAALRYGKLDSATFITTISESESQEATTEPFLARTISSLDFTTNNASTSDRSTAFETVTSIESTESEGIITIDDYTAHEAILTTTDRISVELPTPEDTIDNEVTTTTVSEVFEKNLNPIIGSPNESFDESTDSMMDEENFSKDYDTTSDLIAVNDNELVKSEENVDLLNDSTTESTMEHLPFCDNTVLVHSIRKVINNFTMDPGNLEDSYVSATIPNEELSPEILEIPNLRSFLSIPQIENVIVKNVKNHLLKFAGLPRNSLEGARPSDMIRNTLRNILGVLPKKEPELPPNTVIEHQLRNDEWTTNLVTLLPIEPAEETKNQDSLQKVHENIKNLIYNPAVGLQAAKQNAVQNIIVQAVKHQMENANGVAVEEDTIRDMVGNVLGNAYEKEQNEDKGNSFKNGSAMDTTERIDDENNYDDATSTENKSVEKFYKTFGQVTMDLYSTKNSDKNESKANNAIDIESTTTSEFPLTNAKDTEASDSQKLGTEQPGDCSNNVNPLQATITVPVTIATNMMSTTISDISSTEINDKNDAFNLGKGQSNDYSSYIQNNNFSTTSTYIENLQENHQTEPTDISETTKDITNINEETTVGVPYGDQQRSSETTKRNKGETNESKVLRLPQNSFVGAGNTGIGESSSANQGQSSQGKKKCRLCKMESCTSTHEIVTKVHKRVKTTTTKYYGAKENVASEENPIVSSKHQEAGPNTVASLESQEHVNRSNDVDDVSTTCENLSDENLRNFESNEDVVYEEKISKKKTNDDDTDDLSDLQNSELYYIGDNVKLPLEITKLKDGSYALLISKSICENVLKRKCPCCVPLNGNVRSVKRSPAINGNTDRVSGTRKSAKVTSKLSKKRSRRSTVIDKKSNGDNSVFKDELETLTMPVMTFAKKYNLKLNLDDTNVENTTPDQSKYTNEIDRDNIGSRKRLIARFNDITRDKNKFEEKTNIYRDEDDQIENIDTNNPVFRRMKFIKRMQQNPGFYRRQRAIEGVPNTRTEIIKNLLNWFRDLIL